MRQSFLRVLSTSFVVLLTGCGAGQPTPVPAASTATQQVVSFTTPVHTATRLPTETPTSVATFTSTPVPTDTSIPVPTNAPQPTHTYTPEPTITPEPTSPTATPAESGPPPASQEIESPTANTIIEPTTSAIYDVSSKKGTVLVSPHCEDLNKLQTSWYFNNNIFPSDSCPAVDPRFVPRIYGAQDAFDGARLQTAINNAKTSGWLIGFVEPNLPHHGPMSPEEGARAWRTIEEVALPAGIKLVSPAASQHAPNAFGANTDPYGNQWLWAMTDKYLELYGEKPHFDALAWNIYEADPRVIIQYLSLRREEALTQGYDIPFWITEYAGRCWDTDKYPTGNDAVMKIVTRWFEDTPWIARYSWFTHRLSGDEPWAQNHHSCTLINTGTGELTDLGQMYANY